jgi:hypothetical protein
VWCTEREGRIIDFWIAFEKAIIIVGRLIREAWKTTVGRADLITDHDLLAQSLIWVVDQRRTRIWRTARWGSFVDRRRKRMIR